MLEIMIEIMNYVQSPQYQNYFAQFDKKLTKNILKRCIVEVIAERILSKKSRDEHDETQPEEASEEGMQPFSMCEMDMHLDNQTIVC